MINLIPNVYQALYMKRIGKGQVIKLLKEKKKQLTNVLKKGEEFASKIVSPELSPYTAIIYIKSTRKATYKPFLSLRLLFNYLSAKGLLELPDVKVILYGGKYYFDLNSYADARKRDNGEKFSAEGFKKQSKIYEEYLPDGKHIKNMYINDRIYKYPEEKTEEKTEDMTFYYLNYLLNKASVVKHPIYEKTMVRQYNINLTTGNYVKIYYYSQVKSTTFISPIEAIANDVDEDFDVSIFKNPAKFDYKSEFNSLLGVDNIKPLPGKESKPKLTKVQKLATISTESLQKVIEPVINQIKDIQNPYDQAKFVRKLKSKTKDKEEKIILDELAKKIDLFKESYVVDYDYNARKVISAKIPKFESKPKVTSVLYTKSIIESKPFDKNKFRKYLLKAIISENDLDSQQGKLRLVLNSLNKEDPDHDDKLEVFTELQKELETKMFKRETTGFISFDAFSKQSFVDKINYIITDSINLKQNPGTFRDRLGIVLKSSIHYIFFTKVEMGKKMYNKIAALVEESGNNNKISDPLSYDISFEEEQTQFKFIEMEQPKIEKYEHKYAIDQQQYEDDVNNIITGYYLNITNQSDLAKDIKLHTQDQNLNKFIEKEVGISNFTTISRLYDDYVTGLREHYGIK